MKAETLREMSMEELAQQLEELYQEQFNLRFQKASHQLENSRRIGVVKRDIARVKTIMTELERAHGADGEVE